MSRDLRDVFARFPTGVAVATVMTDAGPVGVTISSFNSVSLEPQLAVFSLTKTLHSTPAFSANTEYAISFLAAGQDAVSGRFARAGSDKFEGAALLNQPGAPMIAGATGYMRLRLHQLIDAGDHLMFLCRIRSFFLGEQSDPLVFCGGRYRNLAS